jgi:hypothetical protein
MATNGLGFEGNQETEAPHERTIGVHVLTEFIYCPRAGLAQFEENRVDEPDGQTPRLDYLPEYEIQKIIEMRARLLRRISALLCVLVGFGVVTGLLGWLVHTFFFLCWLVGSGLLSFLVVWFSYQTVILTARLNAYRRAQRGAPPADLQTDMTVNWWSMLKEGFDCLPGRTTEDEQLRIQGRSYYVLRRGSLAIPVFFYGGNADRVRSQDRVRIAAYCHLLTVNELADSPYGLMLWAGSDEAVAIPNDEASQQMLREALEQARKVIRLSVDVSKDPPPPDNRSRCSDCPIGRPRRYDPRMPRHVRYGTTLRVQFCGNGREKTHHSLCGDRFEWTPPHQIAQERGWV